MVIFYVDDLLLIAGNEKKPNTLKCNLSKRLPANHLEGPIDISGIKLVNSEVVVTLFQTK